MFFKSNQLFALLIMLVLFISIFAVTGCNGVSENKNIVSAKKDSEVNALVSKKNSVLANHDIYDSTKQYVYLTFDDGPQPGTLNCLHTMQQSGVKASFFMVGMHGYDAFLKRIIDTINNNYPQIVLCNHSYTHAFRDRYKTFYTHPYAALEDFKKAQDSLHVHYKIIRLPGNNAWVKNGVVRASKLTKPVCVLLDSAGYEVMGWDVEWNFKPDKGGARPVQSVATMVKMVENTLQKNECYRKNNIVLLAHDRMFHTAAFTDSLHKFVVSLQQNPHYVFETIDKYPMQEGTKNIQ